MSAIVLKIACWFNVVHYLLIRRPNVQCFMDTFTLLSPWWVTAGKQDTQVQFCITVGSNCMADIIIYIEASVHYYAEIKIHGYYINSNNLRWGKSLFLKKLVSALAYLKWKLWVLCFTWWKLTDVLYEVLTKIYLFVPQKEDLALSLYFIYIYRLGYCGNQCFFVIFDTKMTNRGPLKFINDNEIVKNNGVDLFFWCPMVIH